MVGTDYGAELGAVSGRYPSDAVGNVRSVKPEDAIGRLIDLLAEREQKGDGLYNDDTSWKARVRGVLTQAFGRDHHLLKEFDGIRYSSPVYFGTETRADGLAWWRSGMSTAKGLIEAAIYELEGMRPPSDVDASSYHPGLWAEVGGLVEAEDWPKVASQTAIYVEGKIREWAGHPKDGKGGEMVGHALFAHALAEGGPLALGRQANETTGWRNLGIGFVAAVSNVVRHRAQKRTDWKTYGVGVLGLGSLLLTEMEHTYDTSQLGVSGQQ